MNNSYIKYTNININLQQKHNWLTVLLKCESNCEIITFNEFLLKYTMATLYTHVTNMMNSLIFSEEEINTNLLKI